MTNSKKVESSERFFDGTLATIIYMLFMVGNQSGHQKIIAKERENWHSQNKSGGDKSPSKKPR